MTKTKTRKKYNKLPKMAAAIGFKNPGNPVSSHENASKNTNFHAISTHNHTKLSPNINQVIREELHLIHSPTTPKTSNIKISI